MEVDWGSKSQMSFKDPFKLKNQFKWDQMKDGLDKSINHRQALSEAPNADHLGDLGQESLSDNILRNRFPDQD